MTTSIKLSLLLIFLVLTSANVFALIPIREQFYPPVINEPATTSVDKPNIINTSFVSRNSYGLGSNGEHVRELQEFLNSRGFSVKATGYFGDVTLDAVKKFQSTRSLPIVGTVGPLTQSQIAREISSPAYIPSTPELLHPETNKPLSRNQYIQYIQEKLNELKTSITTDKRVEYGHVAGLDTLVALTGIVNDQTQTFMGPTTSHISSVILTPTKKVVVSKDSDVVLDSSVVDTQREINNHTPITTAAPGIETEGAVSQANNQETKAEVIERVFEPRVIQSPHVTRVLRGSTLR